jgi:DNA-binding transcriptional LysR family regulator
MTDRLSGITEFVAVVEAESFASAARKLNLSRSAVGKAICRLEIKLGARLFHRTTRSLHLTREGKAYYEYCQRALAELDNGEAALESGRVEPRGTVRLTVPVIFGRHCVAPTLYDLARQHEALSFEVSFTDRQVDIAEEGYDLAVRNAEMPEGAGLKTRALARQRMVVCASPTYLASHGRPASLEALAAHRCILYAGSPLRRNWLFCDADGKPFEVPIRGRMRLDDIEAIRDAAIAGMGLAWLPCWLVRTHVAAGALVRVLENVPWIELTSWAVWPQTPFLPSRVRILIDALAEELPAMVG